MAHFDPEFKSVIEQHVHSPSHCEKEPTPTIQAQRVQLMVGGRGGHAPESKDQAEQLKEVKERVRERKGRGGISTLFPSFLTPQLILHLKVSIG